MSSKFLHLGVRFEGSQGPERASIETVLNGAKDWFRYAPNCWIIYTSRDADTWYDKLRSVPGMESHTSFFICELNTDNRAGYLKTSFWEWIDKARTKAKPKS